MLFKFKILSSEKQSRFSGMFGDCIKIKISEDDTPIAFLGRELGITEDLIEVKNYDLRKNMLIVDLPDVSYEIIMSWIE